jgi:hypothetical protein
LGADLSGCSISVCVVARFLNLSCVSPGFLAKLFRFVCCPAFFSDVADCSGFRREHSERRGGGYQIGTKLGIRDCSIHFSCGSSLGVS